MKKSMSTKEQKKKRPIQDEFEFDDSVSKSSKDLTSLEFDSFRKVTSPTSSSSSTNHQLAATPSSGLFQQLPKRQY